MNDLLTGKNAIIYGGGGSLGGGVARTFARAGATVFLAGRTLEPLERVAADIAAAAGRAEVAVVDALDERAVDEHADAVAAQAGSIDVSFNLVQRGDDQGDAARRHDHGPVPARDHDRLEDGVHHRARRGAPHGPAGLRRDPASHERVVAGHDARHGQHRPDGRRDGGVPPLPGAELGPSGVRVVGIHTAGVAGTLTPEKIAAVSGDAPIDIAAIAAGLAQMTMLRRAPDVQQIADTATFLASDGAGAGAITSGIVNATCGLVAG